MPSGKKTSRTVDSSANGFSHYFESAYFGATSWWVTWAMLGSVVLLTAICSRIALLNILAYEFTAIIALITCHFTAILVIREFDRIRSGLSFRGPFTPGPHPRLVTWGILLGSMAAVGWILLIALIEILALDMVFHIRNCDPLTGLGFYLGIPVLSSFFAGSIGILCATGTSSRPKAYWMYFWVVMLFVVRVILRITRGHTIGMNDPFLGMIDLPIYEQEAALSSSFIYARIFVFILSIFVVTLSPLLADTRFQVYRLKNIFGNFRRPDHFLPEIQTLTVTVILLGLGLYYMGPLGIEITRRYVEHVLDGTVRTDHFIIRYPTGGAVEQGLDRIIEDHEYYYSAIAKQISPVVPGPIRSYIYPDRSTKTFLTGVGSSVYAKPWTGEIHVEFNPNKIDALEHELVHVMSAPMGFPFFGSSMLGAYGEGIAEGVQYETSNDLTHHQWTAALRAAIDPLTKQPFFPRDSAPLELLTRNLRPGGFYVGRITMNYYLSASHTRWLLDTYGPDAYTTAYLRDDTEKAIGLTQKQEADAWMEYLDHVPVSDDDIAFAAFGFSAPKFTVLVCAHEVAKHERKAGEYSDLGDWKRAKDEYGILLSFSPQNIRYGYSNAQMSYRQKAYDEVLSETAEMRAWSSADAGWVSYLDLLDGDVYARQGRFDDASGAYTKAHDEAINTSLEENAALRLEILKSPAIDDLLAAQEKGADSRWQYERAGAVDSGWLPRYFVGTQLVADRQYGLAETYLLDCVRRNPGLPFVRRTCLYYLGICAYRQGQYELAEQNFQAASQISREIFLVRYPNYDNVIPLEKLDSWASGSANWIDRCEWRKTWQGPAGEKND